MEIVPFPAFAFPQLLVALQYFSISFSRPIDSCREITILSLSCHNHRMGVRKKCIIIATKHLYLDRSWVDTHITIRTIMLHNRIEGLAWKYNNNHRLDFIRYELNVPSPWKMSLSFLSQLRLDAWRTENSTSSPVMTQSNSIKYSVTKRTHSITLVVSYIFTVCT